MAGVPASNESPARRAARLSFGTTLALLVAQLGNWPIAFILPVVVLALLMDASPFSFRDGWRMFGSAVFFFLFAGVMTSLLQPYPAVLVLVMAVMLYRMSLWLITSDAALLTIVSALIGFTAVPIVTNLLTELGALAALAFILNWALGIPIAAITWFLIPPNRPLPQSHHADALEPATARQLALILTVILVPLMTAFLVFSWTKILVAVYAVLFALMFSSESSKGEGLKYLTANLVYASVGVFVCYELMVLVPSVVFLVPVMAAALLIYAWHMFRGGATAPFWESGIFGFLIMTGGMLTKENVDAGGTLFLRLWQMALAVGYVVAMYMILEWLVALSEGKKPRDHIA